MGQHSHGEECPPFSCLGWGVGIQSHCGGGSRTGGSSEDISSTPGRSERCCTVRRAARSTGLETEGHVLGAELSPLGFLAASGARQA